MPKNIDRELLETGPSGGYAPPALQANNCSRSSNRSAGRRVFSGERMADRMQDRTIDAIGLLRQQVASRLRAVSDKQVLPVEARVVPCFVAEW